MKNIKFHTIAVNDHYTQIVLDEQVALEDGDILTLDLEDEIITEVCVTKSLPTLYVTASEKIKSKDKME